MTKPWLNYWPEGVPQTIDYGTRSLPAIVLENCKRWPDKTAIIYYGCEISYQELGNAMKRFAAWLQNNGVQRGDRVAIYMENTPHFVITYHAILAAGAVAVCLNPMFKETELEYHLNDSGAETLITLAGLFPIYKSVKGKTKVKRVVVGKIADYLPENPVLPPHPSMLNEPEVPENVHLFQDILTFEKELDPVALDIKKELALLQYTSGTTGNPKGAMITHRSLLVNIIGSKYWWKIEPGEVFLAVLPFFHVTGMLHCMCQPLYSGGTMILFTRYDTESVIRAIEMYKVTFWSSIATMNIAVLNFPDVRKYDLTSLKSVKSGGAKIPLETLQAFSELTGVYLIEGYGLSETISQITGNPPHRPKTGSVGIPVSDVDIKIVDQADPSIELPAGEVGELIVTGPQVMKGYWNRPEETKKSFYNEYLLTGDLAYMDEEGYFYISGRKKELIKASGYSVFPAEVENYLYMHPAIAECCVYGVPHSYRGEEICAAVVLKDEYNNQVTAEDIIAWAKEHMSAYKYPRIVEIRDSLPKNASGKILRRLLTDTAKKV
ncbi:AMP-binding protein [Pueribacillus theae]|nr:AMP-binding protein [Pueribacillus theae]